MALAWGYNAMQQDITFTLTIDAQKILVRYWPHYFIAAGYARFEFTSPHNPPCKIQVSETGYLSYFLPQHEVDTTMDIKEFAYILAMALMAVNDTLEVEQLSLF